MLGRELTPAYFPPFAGNPPNHHPWTHRGLQNRQCIVQNSISC